MIKLKLLSIFFIFSLSNILYAEIVKKIEISGNNRVNSETIEMFSNISIGDDISSDDLNNSLKDLYETNFFEDVNLLLNNSTLIIRVKENMIIQNLIISGVKNKTLNEKIIDTINIKAKSPFVESKIKQDLVVTKDLLQQSGFYFSEVNLSKQINDNNTINLIFDINLGEKAFINEIIFTGDKKFKKRKLLNVITSEENKFWKFISNKKLLNKQRIDLDKRLIQNFYKNKGYYQVKVLEETIQYDENSNFKLVFNINAGKKFYFNEFKIQLPDDYDKSYFNKITKKLNSYSGEKYSFKVLDKILNEIEKIATDKQYEFLNANIDEQIVKGDKIDVEIQISDDDYKTYVQKINILGNNITIEDVIRNELIIDEGDPLNQILFSKSVSNIKSLNIFKNVETKIIDGDDEYTKIINIKVDEKPTGEIALGAGIGTSGASTMFGIKENNFLGKGIKLNSNLSLSEETIRGLFSYTRPNYKNSNRDLILSVESQETDRLTDFGYKTNDTGFMIGTRFEHLEDFFIRPSLSANYESIETSSSASSLLKKQEGSYLDVELNYTLDLDKRDQPFQPTDGYRSIFSQKVPFNINENQTLINSYEYQTYHEYYDDIIASVSFMSKAANSFGDDSVRISERLYMPSRKLRGFQSGKVGPIDNGDYVGGNYIASFNASTNVPIFESLETINFNLFYDAANIWGVDYNSSINDSNALRSSTGIGIDWYTPVGPLNFSFTQPITKKATDKTETFRFNLGTTF
ncbi:outer membrane protein assembly factor BamA [Candidatus Pelagibacter sp.]|nr:outer membrane protein assembly factor BamA [Candidatus Pelagibacter sp.]